MVGDLSTVYFFSEKSAKNIHEYNPNIKLILLLRNPIDRAYAHYLQDIKVGHIPYVTSFKVALDKYPNIKKWGNYKDHLKNYFSLFKEEQIKVLLFDDIKTRPKQLIKEVYSYLNVDNTFIPKALTRKINAARLPKYSGLDSLMRRSSDLLRSHSLGEKLWWKLKHSSLIKYYYRKKLHKAE